jgi:SAM-dependent methyltransferase
MMKAVWTVDGDETSWNSWAEAMAEAPASALVQELIEEIPSEQHTWALDLGCGTGRAFKPLNAGGWQVIGVDPSATGIRLSRQKAVQEHLDAYPIIGSAAYLSLPDESMSLVLAISVLFHLGPQELTLALNEIYRILRPDGKALLHFLDCEDWRRILAPEFTEAQIPCPGYQAVVTCFCSRDMLENWLKQSRFLIETMEMRTSPSEGGQQRNWIVCCRK